MDLVAGVSSTFIAGGLCGALGEPCAEPVAVCPPSLRTQYNIPFASLQHTTLQRCAASNRPRTATSAGMRGVDPVYNGQVKGSMHGA